jgi:hypothetical protein
MSLDIVSSVGGVVTIRVTGLFSPADQAKLQEFILASHPQQGSLSILAIVEDFQGWQQASTWEDVSLMEKNDPYIRKMAIVGEKQWEDMALLFTAKGLRLFPIEYFLPTDLARAQAWLMAD